MNKALSVGVRLIGALVLAGVVLPLSTWRLSYQRPASAHCSWGKT